MALTIDPSAVSFASFGGMGSVVRDSIAAPANKALESLNATIKTVQAFENTRQFKVENATPQGNVELAKEAKTEAAMAGGRTMNA